MLASERAEAQRHALRRPQDVREPLFGSANGALPTGSQTASPAIPRPEIDGQVGRMNAVLGDIGYVLGRAGAEVSAELTPSEPPHTPHPTPAISIAAATNGQG